MYRKALYTSRRDLRAGFRRVFPALLALFALAGTAAAQGSGGITIDRVREDVRYLAGDELAGRRAGEPGNLLAAAYIAARFQKLGLEVVPNGEGYYHRFGYVAGARAGSMNKLILFAPSGRKELKGGVDFNPMSFSDVSSIVGDLLFAGYGISAPDENYDDYAGIDPAGKIVVVMRYSPEGSETHSRFARQMAFTSKVKAAKERGAAGIIFISRPNDEQNLYPLTLDRSFLSAGIPVMFALSGPFDGVRDPAGRTLSQIQAMIDSTKSPASFVMQGYSASLAADVTIRRDSIPNVLAMLPGTDPKLRDEIIVIGGHFDHLGHGGEGSLHGHHDSAVHYGADDNASGTAGVMALAEHFAATRANRRTLIFMAFNAEEEGLIGSAALMNTLSLAPARIVTMINMDMIGRLDSSELVVQGIGTSTAWEPLVKELNRDRFNLKLVPDGFGPSDHSSFYGKDIPVLSFFTNLHEDYHRPGDTWEKVNYEGEVEILRYVAEIVGRIDAMPERPPFTKAPSSRAGGRSGNGFKVYVGTIPDYAYEGKGLKLTGVADGGPAALAGLKGGDIIVKMGGKAIDNIYDYTDALGIFSPKQEVETEFLRDGTLSKTTITMRGR